MKAHLPSGCHHAGIISRRAVAGLELTEITYAPGLRLPMHRHERAGFCLVLSGTYSEDYGMSSLPCRPQTVTFSPAKGRRLVILDIGPNSLEECARLDFVGS